jgi:hypothetical protein
MNRASNQFLARPGFFRNQVPLDGPIYASSAAEVRRAIVCKLLRLASCGRPA